MLTERGTGRATDTFVDGIFKLDVAALLTSLHDVKTMQRLQEVGAGAHGEEDVVDVETLKGRVVSARHSAGPKLPSRQQDWILKGQQAGCAYSLAAWAMITHRVACTAAP